MSKKRKRTDDECEGPAGSEADVLDAIMDPSTWIADYPPWFAEPFITSCKEKTREEAIRLLHIRQAIESRDHKAIVRFLKEGVDPSTFLGKEDGTLLSFAFQYDADDIIRTLLDAGADVSRPGLVHQACDHVQRDLLERLLAAGADPNATWYGAHALPAVCGWGKLQAVLLLLDAGADPDGVTTISPDNKHEVTQCTGMMLAAWQGRTTIVKALIAAGADLQRTDSQGNTALDWARVKTSKNCLRVAELLEQAGARGGKGVDLGVVDIPDFTTASNAKPFKKALVRLAELTGAKPERICLDDGDVKGGKAFLVDEARAVEIVAAHREALLAEGAYIFKTSDVTDRNGPCVVALPTSDPFEAVAAMQTQGMEAISTAELIQWLKQLHEDQPFVMGEIGFDRIRGTFTGDIKDPLTIVRQVNAICPDRDTGEKAARQQAKTLAREREFFLWWD